MKLSNWQQLKVRTDLVISPQTHQGQLHYVIKDPLTLRYFRIRPTEYAILRMLDGQTPVDEVRKRLAILGHDISEEDIQTFLKQMGASNFFENVLPNQSESLYQMAQLRRKRASLWSQAKRIIYIKIPLVDPNRLFDRVMPYIRFLWSPWAFALYLALIAFGSWTVWSDWDEAKRVFYTMLTPEGIFILSIVFIVEKVFHELGHGLTCKRYDGAVHDMGLLVIAGFPCMYCNISDSWIMEKPSRKVYISAAGIVTELIIAALAAIVWRMSEPGGTTSLMAFRLMFVAGVSSVLINGNPLMKWDGYYILSDALGLPNLRANSVRYVGQFFRKYLLGMEAPEAGRFDRTRFIYVVYGVLSTWWLVYVMYSITAGMLHRFPAVGVWVLVTTLWGVTFVPAVRIIAYVRKRRAKKSGAAPARVNLRRVAATTAVMAACCYFFFIHDAGYNISAPCVIMPVESQSVKARTPGVLVSMPVGEGSAVRAGDVVAVLSNPDLESSLRELIAEKKVHEVERDCLMAQGMRLKADVSDKLVSELELRIEEARERVAGLTVRAAVSGVVLSPRPEAQLGRFIPVGDTIVEIGDVSRVKVTIALAEKDLRFVSVEAPAGITLRSYPWRSFEGTVASISKASLRFLPSPALSSAAGGTVLTRTDENSPLAPTTPTYEVSIQMPNSDGMFLVGMAGKVRISAGTRRIWDIVYTRARESIKTSFGV